MNSWLQFLSSCVEMEQSGPSFTSLSGGSFNPTASSSNRVGVLRGWISVSLSFLTFLFLTIAYGTAWYTTRQYAGQNSSSYTEVNYYFNGASQSCSYPTTSSSTCSNSSILVCAVAVSRFTHHLQAARGGHNCGKARCIACKTHALRSPSASHVHLQSNDGLIARNALLFAQVLSVYLLFVNILMRVGKEEWLAKCYLTYDLPRVRPPPT
ncbi:MAG: hypothetical protein EOO65_03000 [Methanosarcinales archaeon]|nr:MAG: hypothetical protein EOO65_03000 [Methanosarcinales archaeon]